MANEIRLYDPDGRPVQRRGLTREAGAPTLTGVRQLWREVSVAVGLTPQRLAAILRTSSDGEQHQRDFLTLAEEMEEREPHYSSVLRVRKNAVSGIEPAVESATDEARDVEMADAVRMLIRKPEFGDMLDDCLDALGKGYSVVEIIWDRSGPVWQPRRYKWRDPRFFVFDRTDLQTLRLLDDENSHEGIPLDPYKWIIHRPRLKSGITMRGGLARLVALSYMAKSYAITDWLGFAEVFGMPLRLGLYGENATEEDINKLIHAVANLGTDAAAAIPDSMRIEFTEPGSRQGGDHLFERLATYLDKQISKAVLGQTMTTDDGSSRSQAEVHNEVRGDILQSDARQLENTINRDLVKPFIVLNFGPQKDYPRFMIPVKGPEDINSLVTALKELVPLGLGAEASVIRDKLGLPDPADGAELLMAPAATAPTPEDTEQATNRRGARATNRSEKDELEDLIDDAASEWEPQLRPLADAIRALARRSRTFTEFRRGLPRLLAESDSADLTEHLAVALLKARGIGDAGD